MTMKQKEFVCLFFFLEKNRVGMSLLWVLLI